MCINRFLFNLLIKVLIIVLGKIIFDTTAKAYKYNFCRELITQMLIILIFYRRSACTHLMVMNPMESLALLKERRLQFSDRFVPIVLHF